LGDLGPSQDHRVVPRALDPHGVAGFDHGVPLPRGEAHFILRLFEETVGGDQQPGLRARGDERCEHPDQDQPLEAGAVGEPCERRVDAGRQQDADEQRERSVEKDRAGIVAEKRARDDGQIINQPEAEDRFERQRPVGEPPAVGGARLGRRRHF